MDGPRLDEAIQRRADRINPYRDDTTPDPACRLIRRALAEISDCADVDDLADNDKLVDAPMAEVVAGLTVDQLRGVCISLAEWVAANHWQWPATATATTFRGPSLIAGEHR
jgi:hypothetical protein